MAANSNKAALNIKDVVYKKRDGLWDAFDINNEPAALWVWGYGFEGQLGNNAASRVSSPIQVGALSDWAKITNTAESTIVIKRDGTLWAWGNSSLVSIGFRSSPTQVGALTNWRHVVGGYDHAMAIKTDGTLWGWGNGTYGALGTGDTGIYTSPVQIGIASNWSLVSCGRANTFAVKNDGTLWACGNNTVGEYGIGDTVNRSSLIQVGSGFSMISCNNYNTTSTHNIAIKTDGTMWAAGINNFGHLGDGTTTNRSTRVQIGSSTDWANVSTGLHSIAIKTDGSIWSWGLQREW